MSFSESARICLQKYIDFNGRASRSEYWWFVLLTFALGFIPVIGWLIRLALLLPSPGGAGFADFTTWAGPLGGCCS